jgi:tetratricopeptide (TPR) repeat protein
MGDMLDLGGGEAAEIEAGFVGDSAAVGLALDRTRARRGKAGDAAADRFLAAQEGLIADQRHHLREQFRHLRLKHFSERLKVALQLLTVTVGVALVATLGWMALDAARADGVVIKPFTVAPDLARRGVTGEVVASQLLDKLTEITDRAQSSGAAGNFGAGWGQNISIQIPETGVSLGELDRWLREKLGHEQALAGEVVQNPDGTLTLSARLGARALPPQTGAPPDLPQLILKAAEQLYRREQPITYVQYLGRAERRDEAADVHREMVESHDPVTRASGYGGLGLDASQRGDPAAAARYYRAADAEGVGLSWPVYDLGVSALRLGQAEEALRLQRRGLALTPHDPSLTAQGAREQTLDAELGIASELHDHATVLAKAISQRQGDKLGRRGSRSTLLLDLASARAAAHDGLSSDIEAEGFAPLSAADAQIKAGALASIARDREDWETFLARAEAATKLSGQSESLLRASNRAVALARLGRIADAHAVIDPTPLDCQPCVVSRGEVADAERRWAQADHWFAEGSRMAPSLPNAPLDWGQALLARGAAARAAVQFREALRRSPRAEEATEGLGEALLAEGDAAGAAGQFEKALKLTPRWGRAHLKWGEALARLGKLAEARAQLRAAAGLDLTAPERAELAAQRI